MRDVSIFFRAIVTRETFFRRLAIRSSLREVSDERVARKSFSRNGTLVLGDPEPKCANPRQFILSKWGKLRKLVTAWILRRVAFGRSSLSARGAGTQKLLKYNVVNLDVSLSHSAYLYYPCPLSVFVSLSFFPRLRSVNGSVSLSLSVA